MGNSQSTTAVSTTPARHPTKKTSTNLRGLSCQSAAALSDPPSVDTFLTVVEKRSVDSDAIPIFGALSAPILTRAYNNDDTFTSFLKLYPEYQLTWILDALRRSDFTRLDLHNEVYVDYMGGSLYPESLIRLHSTFLQQQILGNTHSVSNSSAMSTNQASIARAAVLSFFKAPPEYTVVFTANASAALKLVGEAYPFAPNSSFVLAEDSHNSVHGIREYASRAGSTVCYIPATSHGGVEETAARSRLYRHRPYSASTPCLFALTGQSNISNCKNPLSLISYAQTLGYHTLLDAAALAPTSLISLTETRVDAMAVSFYKMFGYPTGVGGLVVKRSFLAQMRRPWFAGGTVDVVQVPGAAHTMSSHIHEQFEDGTINYLSLPAITDGLRFLSAYLPFLPLRLSALLHYLSEELSALRHPSGAPVAIILSRRPGRRLKYVGEQSDTGSIISFLFISPNGAPVPNSFIAHAAAANRISLRTGCMCNPGGAAALLGLRELMAGPAGAPGVTLEQLESREGRELGVVRISLGLASNWEDVRSIMSFASKFADTREVAEMKKEWMAGKANEERGLMCS